MTPSECMKWTHKDYKENVVHTEYFQTWKIEIEGNVEIMPDWFDPDYDDYYELKEMELIEKGFQFYISKNKKLFHGIWCFRTRYRAIEEAKNAIVRQVMTTRQRGYRVIIPKSENPYEI